jgi:hypothetical protein
MGPPWSNNPFHPPFPQQALLPPTTFVEEKEGGNHRTMQRADLHFLQFALMKSQDRVDLNRTAYRRPTHMYQSNSCPPSLGGYSNKGFAWRFYLEPKYQSSASNNLLKHIAAITTLWVDIIAGQLTHGNCTLFMTVSMASEGWLKKTNFIKEGEDPI